MVTFFLRGVIPELPALRLSPRVGALIDGYSELRRLLEKLQQIDFGRFHWLTPSVLTISPSSPLREGKSILAKDMVYLRMEFRKAKPHIAIHIT